VWQARLGRVLRLWGFDLFGLLLIVLWGFILRSMLRLPCHTFMFEEACSKRIQSVSKCLSTPRYSLVGIQGSTLRFKRDEKPEHAVLL
jgi:hypothetical protein